MMTVNEPAGKRQSEAGALGAAREEEGHGRGESIDGSFRELRCCPAAREAAGGYFDDCFDRALMAEYTDPLARLRNAC